MAARYFRTHSGKHVHPLAPQSDEIEIADVARSLSRQCRFLGHLDCHYSIAQHSVLVSKLVPTQDALWGLLHDASEAYLSDLPAPIKRDPEMSVYRIAEHRLMVCIACKFGLPSQMPDSVIVADKVVLVTEFRDLTTVGDPEWIRAECGVNPMRTKIVPWPSALAEKQFLRRFRELAR